MSGRKSSSWYKKALSFIYNGTCKILKGVVVVLELTKWNFTEFLYYSTRYLYISLIKLYKGVRVILKLHTVSVSVCGMTMQGMAGPSDDVLGQVVTQKVVFCPMCPAHYDNRPALRDHINGMHYRRKCYRCEACGEGFLWRAQLSIHRRKAPNTSGACRCAGLS